MESLGSRMRTCLPGRRAGRARSRCPTVRKQEWKEGIEFWSRLASLRRPVAAFCRLASRKTSCVSMEWLDWDVGYKPTDHLSRPVGMHLRLEGGLRLWNHLAVGCVPAGQAGVLVVPRLIVGSNQAPATIVRWELFMQRLPFLFANSGREPGPIEAVRFS